MWTSQYYKFENPYTWVNSGGLGTMGFSVPAAIGAKVGRPDKMVWAVDGDGCFQMTAQEMVTAASERIPVKIAILNNSYLGMVRQWQEMFYDERYSEVFLSPDLPDYVKWAEAMGCAAFRVEDPSDIEPTIDKANAIDDRPVVVEFRTDSGEKVFPMVAAGLGNDDIEVGPHGFRPDPDDVGLMSAPKHHILSVLVLEPRRRARTGLGPLRPPGVQHRVAGGGADRRPEHPRFTIVVDVESTPLEQITKQLFKLIDVLKISELDPADCVERELTLVTVKADAAGRGQVVELVTIFEGTIVDVGHDCITASFTGRPSKLDDFTELLRPFGIVELQRTGRIALQKAERSPRLKSVNSKAG